MVQGIWKGFLISKTLDSYNKNGLPVTLYIVDDNDDGDLFGEMTVSYRYQNDVYKAKYKIEGNIDYSNFKMSLEQTKIIFYDILPKGLEWCFGSGSFRIFRSTYAKKNYIDGIFKDSCGERYRLVLVKK